MQDEIFQVRLKKLENFRAKGLNPYPDKFARSHSLSEAKELKLGKKKIKVAGRIMTMRTMGKLIFATLQDFSGKLQIALKEDCIGKEDFKFFAKNFDMGDFVGVEGEIFKTQKGEVTINVDNYQLLSKALRPLPEKWHGLKEQETKYRQRYLDLTMSEETRERFLFRSQLIKALREFYWQEGFVEIETPYLENVSSGATARPFITHHNALDIDVYLRIAAGELWQKTAIVGGFEKTFEVARCFRNEGLNPSHLQEFTMIEHYAAYWNFEDNMQFTERMFAHFLKELLGTTKVKIKDPAGKEREINFKPPWPRYEFCKLVKKDCDIDILAYEKVSDLRKAIKDKGIKIDEIDKLGFGNLADHLYKKVSRPKLLQPCFVIKHLKETKPLARLSDDNPKLCDTFQLLVNGWEMINAYGEIVNPTDQRERFEEQAKAKAKGDEDAMAYNEEYLTTMEHGMPPMSGWGMGIDRLVTLLTGQENLKDVVLFPLMRPEENPKPKIQNPNEFPNPKSQTVRAQNFEPQQSTISNMDLEIPSPNITYSEALELAKKHYTDEITFKHCREAEVVMRGLAKRLRQAEDVWGIAGLLHDLDWDYTKENDKEHCVKIRELLKDTKVNPEFTEFLITHGYGTPCGDMQNTKRTKASEHALVAAETITGLIFASALVRPDKKLASVEVKSIKKKMKDKSFAAKVSRDVIKEIELVGISVDEFIEISLKNMQGIANELGL